MATIHRSKIRKGKNVARSEGYIRRLVPWFGSKSSLASDIIRQLGPHNFYVECFAGSMAVLLNKPAAESELVVDMHGGITNMALVLQQPDLAVELFKRLKCTIYSEVIMHRSWEELNKRQFKPPPDLDYAYNFFVTLWMSKIGGSTDTTRRPTFLCQFTGGGDVSCPYRGAIDSIPMWVQRLQRVQIANKDIFKVLPKITDADGTAIYADPPYIAETLVSKKIYEHNFGKDDHQRLADLLCRFKKARVVVSYYDDGNLSKLYPGFSIIACPKEKSLSHMAYPGMEQKVSPEVLLVNGPVRGIENRFFS